MWELGIQQQKLRHAQRTDLSRVRLAISLKRRARFQQTYPLEIFFTFNRLIERVRQAPEMRADQARQFVGALDEAPELNVLPAFAVRHGRIGHALKQMRSLAHRPKKYIRMQQPGLALGGASYLKIQTVELLPHLRAALLAHLAQIFSSRRHA